MTVAQPAEHGSLMDTVGRDDIALRRFLRGLPRSTRSASSPRPDAVVPQHRDDSKRWALDLAVSMVDLTTLEGNDTPGKVRSLCAKAVHPDPTDPQCPRVAAVCLYPDLIEHAVAQVAGTGVAVASVATAFPSGRASRATRLADVGEAVNAGADEIDMVIDRGAFLAGRYGAGVRRHRGGPKACGAART